MELSMSSSIAVITSTIGRETLHDTIKSVQSQTRKAIHYVFVHGKEFEEKSKVILNQYNGVVPIYLPNNNGNDGYGMAPVYALAPFVISEDILCYLDDDNFYEKNHIQKTVGLIEENNLDWAYSLRRIVDNDGNYICDDDCESLGYFPNTAKQYLVDNSCYVVKTNLARQTSYKWYYPICSDRNFLKGLLESKAKCGCTGEATVNYRLSKDGSLSMSKEAFIENNNFNKNRFKGEFAWRKASTFIPE